VAAIPFSKDGKDQYKEQGSSNPVRFESFHNKKISEILNPESIPVEKNLILSLK
jgi:hypothetical protein